MLGAAAGDGGLRFLVCWCFLMLVGGFLFEEMYVVYHLDVRCDLFLHVFLRVIDVSMHRCAGECPDRPRSGAIQSLRLQLLG